MIDLLLIQTRGGIVLLERRPSKNTAAVPSNTSINLLLAQAFLNETTATSSTSSTLVQNTTAFKWTTLKDIGLIIIAAYQKFVNLVWLDEFLAGLATLFDRLYHSHLAHGLSDSRYHAGVAAILDDMSQPSCQLAKWIDQRIASYETEHGSSETTTYVDGKAKDRQMDKDTSTGLSPGSGRATVASRKTDQQEAFLSKSPLHSPVVSSGEETDNLARRPRKKKGRKWDADGFVADDNDGAAALDYSDANGTAADKGFDYLDEMASVSGTPFVLRDMSGNTSMTSSGGESRVLSYFKSIIGGKTLHKADLDPVLDKMYNFLLEKNVARPVAENIMTNVRLDLENKTTGSWESVNTAVRNAFSRSLTRILTSTTPTSLLQEIAYVNTTLKRPFVISVVGVNGVGKSTSLSKIAYWLLSSNLSILLAACDTFRSGAVEQLAVHVKNLSQLYGARRIELFSRGYGKDAAVVAKDAVDTGKREKFDIVLIDTAGRRHNDQRLMGSLEKFATLAQPDKILMVAEALVGTDSLHQARNFNAALGHQRSLDGFIISKVDTVGDMVGTIVSMTYEVGIPVLFVGVGQMYPDLRSLSVDWVVERLLS